MSPKRSAGPGFAGRASAVLEERTLDHEFRHGGYGYHEKWFPNLITLLGSLDEAELRRRVLE
jgi:hypothetical protein